MERMQPPPNYYGTPLGYTNNPGFNGQQPPRPGMMQPPGQQPMGNQPIPPQPPMQEEYHAFPPQPIPHTGLSIYEVLNANRGKTIKVYCTFTSSSKWHDVVFEGVCTSAGQNFIILKEGDNVRHHLINTKYVNYLEFLELPILP